MTTTKVLVGILGAAAAGLVIGMLIAPEKGSELRRNIRATADDWVDEVNQWIARGKEYVNEFKNRSEAEANNLQRQAEEGMDSMSEDLARRRL